jgi:DNA polymerase elongation subunit (family B)|tara:strand:- start:1227 stop:5057 length:3831 start_codon:yes stop_codon:yes gene_type:complete
MSVKEQPVKLLDFNIYDEVRESASDSSSSSDSEVSSGYKYKQDEKRFVIQIFGINETGETFCIFVNDYKPFFYVKVDDDWNQDKKLEFLNHIKTKVGKYYENSICECKLIKRKKLYGFDGGKEHKFVLLKFNNTIAMNKVKNLYYYYGKNGGGRRLMDYGYKFQGTSTYLYEANIPPLLRYFHIKEISPSGWIGIPLKKAKVAIQKKSTCKFEYELGNNDIIPLNDKETVVPYKICSFDIEASSSHGDFPVPIKSYKKLAISIMEHYDASSDEISKGDITKIIKTAFGYDDIVNIDKVYPKIMPKLQALNKLVERLYNEHIKDLCKEDESNENTIEAMFEKMNSEVVDEEDNDGKCKYDKNRPKLDLDTNIIDLINNTSIKREEKVDKLTDAFRGAGFPNLEGDKVTFIGSTFLKYGEEKPYLNNCLALDTCSNVDEIENSEIVSYKTERELLMAWKELILKEDPDIIIGYNIFGFDYQFIHIRARENHCEEEFLKLSRNINEICGDKEEDTGKIKIEESKIVLASGEHDLKFIKMNGRLQVDMYNYFRRDYNLTSYKLDYVSGYFIGDDVKKLEHSHEVDNDNDIDNECSNAVTKIFSKNLSGLENGSYINFEETSHSTDYYKDGQKFKVSNVDKDDGTFEIEGTETPDMTKHVKWGLAKDDVTPQDIFRMTNEGPDERAIIAKYCIQDCNLVHHLMNKIDVITGYTEMSKICSVPINFLVMRGQGIKLTSYIAKKCREKKTLMPVLEKPMFDDGYEGAIVLEPKCNLYLDNPVACVDYSSLYPSSMISENLSHDSKVWTKEYDLYGNQIMETGEKDCSGNFMYDNLPGYEYVNVEYDTFKWIPNARGKVEKTHSGTKVCRFAQFPEGRAIMPSILEELLASRKATRKLIPLQTDEFMKNILDKRQTSYKLTANSLYGQCGAKTSTFYEKDVAASCTAIGRKLLTYGKRVIEETYGNIIVDTKFGKVHSNAEYVYGDTDSVFFTFNLKTLEGEEIRGQKALEITIELAKEAGAMATKFLKKPHDLEYEKTFMPFCLLSKKRYVGMLYENDPNKGSRKSMGIVLKRRDNAPIVKDVYGGIIDILMKEKNIQKAVEFLQTSLQNIIEEKYPMDKLIITKSLRSNYKNPKQIAHKVLADRMGKRDPGNKPSSGDRIPFVYIETKNKAALQGEKIEHPEYIVKNKIRPNYSFYITNQIMKPVQQVFALVLEDIDAFKRQKRNFQMKVDTFKNTMEDGEKLNAKISDLRNKEVKVLLFDKYLRETNNLKNNMKSITSFFK